MIRLQGYGRLSVALQPFRTHDVFSSITSDLSTALIMSLVRGLVIQLSL